MNAAKRNVVMSLLNVSLIAKQILNVNQLVTEILFRARKCIILRFQSHHVCNIFSSDDCPCQENCFDGCPCYSYHCDDPNWCNATDEDYSFASSTSVLSRTLKDTITISLNQGDVIGTSRDGVQAFKGIPYGKAARWARPVPIVPWSDPVEAIGKYPKCHQDPSGLGKTYDEYNEMVQNNEISEDCLFLDIYIPEGVSIEELPIFVFVHGGGFIAGSSQDFSPEGLAKQGMIVILPQYRLVTVHNNFQKLHYVRVISLFEPV